MQHESAQHKAKHTNASDCAPHINATQRPTVQHHKSHHNTLARYNTTQQTQVDIAHKPQYNATTHNATHHIMSQHDVAQPNAIPRNKTHHNNAIPNTIATPRMGDMLVIGSDVKKVNRRNQKCILLKHDRFPNATLHCVV